MLRYRYLILVILIIAPLAVSAQDIFTSKKAHEEKDALSSEELRKHALNVFLDCSWCDRDYIKQVIPYVNYVTNKDDADVHILVRRQTNGGGGSEYIIDFIGSGDFKDLDDQLKFISPVDETRDETRVARSGIISMGLMQYVSRTPIGRNIKIIYENKGVPERILNPTVADDPWDSWMFRLRASGSINRDENYNNSNIETSLSADRVTPELKVEFDAEYELNQRVYKLLETETIQREWKLNGLIVKSLSPRWSAGIRSNAFGSIKNNYDYSISAGPAIEYNIFPYEESFKHQVRLQYGVQSVYNNYSDTTTLLKTDELIFKHSLSVTGGVNKEWGNGYIYITYSNYLHDFELYNLTIGGRIDYRIYKGLSVNFRTSASIIHDQINLRLEGATTDEILTQQYALKSGYKYSFSVGLTYSFGSIYNNVVNTRFGN